MIVRLKIENLILIEEAEISFQEGLNVITGETGAGKTALLKALLLLSGAKFDQTLIREGKDKARVAAEFSFPQDRAFLEKLSEGGVELDPGEDLILVREITKEGKSKSYLNNQPLTLQFIKEISPFFLRVVKQETSHLLRDVEEQARLLDSAASVEEELDEFRLLYLSLRSLERQLQELETKEAKRVQEEAHLLEELGELKSLSLKVGELEAIEGELKELSLSGDYSAACQKIGGALDAVLPELSQLRPLFDQLVKISPRHEDEKRLFETARIELVELKRTIDTAAEKRDVSEAYLEALRERLSVIKKACRRYGKEVEEVLDLQKEMEEKLSQLNDLDLEILRVKERLVEEKKALDQVAKLLSKKRHAAKELFERSIHRHLADLGMEKARFSVQIKPSERTVRGDDAVQFFLAANVGEKAASLADSVSGGELQRVLLALETYFSEKGGASSILFDEIDANIGGVTATLVGKKLKELSKQKQVIVITHFPQVARFSDLHLYIEKREVKGRTITTIASLDAKGQELELSRMAGGPSSLSF